MPSKIRLDSRGIAAVLQSPAVTSKVKELGASVASNVGTPTASGRAIPVETRVRIATGGRLRGARTAVDITLADPAGMAVEAKRGPLVKAAAATGLEVKRKK